MMSQMTRIKAGGSLICLGLYSDELEQPLTPSFLETPAIGATRATLLLAHGAGAPMDSDYLNQLADALAVRGIRVLRFEFPYMASRRETGGKRPPNPMPVLLESFRAHFAAAPTPLYIGGKSMGGRVASLLADELQPAGLICFGYPFHPPGKPEKTRTEHLAELRTRALILQGTRDPFGKPDEVASYALSPQVQVSWLETGDHDLKPLKSSGLSQADLINQAAEQAAAFMLN
ncbi:Esterase/lipase/thioesterase family active site protein [Pseudomonas saudimassiliensis]|uniref:Esterase/lipase/thioesterase family active site protein n=1 Tax=Pseudomonas saudimassiliensis TaxID=1461581 RepID=A0A078MG21_9PSED|nr:Esterase/lipase/thioesterase family active site protein [Pseudomonas saudimassiliensis]CEF27688.1 Esterase/lipase/thioesterase family active site protein [Pseudomonas saudimassiliensis]